MADLDPPEYIPGGNEYALSRPVAWANPATLQLG